MPKKYGNFDVRPRGQPKVAAAGAITRLFVVTDGDMTMMAYPSGGIGDPGGQFASNMMEVKNDRVAQWWFSGPSEGGMAPAPAAFAQKPAAAPAAAAPTSAPKPPDYSQYYPTPGAVTADMPTLINNGTGTRAERDGNKKLVAAFFDEFFNKGHTAVAAQYLSPALKSHIAGTPQGADFAAFAAQSKVKVTSADTSQVLFELAEGNVVNIGFPVPYNRDPGAWYTQNLVRVENGKITEWWYSSRAPGGPRYIWKKPAA
jgi:predicted SnoaL-like aldol condensation-catalyzing enzyme